MQRGVVLMTIYVTLALFAVGIPGVAVAGRPKLIYLATHTSTSRSLAVAEAFRGDNGGLILDFDNSIGGDLDAVACDVSWVSVRAATSFWAW